MKTIIALMMLTAAAQAQALYVQKPCTRPSGVCPLSELWVEVPQRIVPDNGVTISNHTPKCEDGWSLVHAGRPMCARELREPK